MADLTRPFVVVKRKCHSIIDTRKYPVTLSSTPSGIIRYAINFKHNRRHPSLYDEKKLFMPRVVALQKTPFPPTLLN